MKNTIKICSSIFLRAILFNFFINSFSSAQEVVASQGELVVANNIICVYTIGEPIISTFRDSAIIVSSGFNQAERVIINSSGVTNEIQLKVFPNPTSNEVIVVSPIANVKYYLYECTGRNVPITIIILSDRIVELSFSHLPAGFYLLRAENNEHQFLSLTQIVKQ